MTPVRLQASQLLGYPNIRQVCEDLGEKLRDEEKARRRFRASLSEDVRAEFINGKVVRHLAARDRHTVVTAYVSDTLDRYVRLGGLGKVRREQALTAFSRNDYAPDICFWGKTKSRGIMPDQLIYSVPDMICEVLSPSTAATDRGVKFDDYEAHGVAEYWIIDPVRETIEQYVRTRGRYRLLGRLEKGLIRSRAVRGFKMPVRAAFDEAENLAFIRKLMLGP
jgi:Uma2 family endonuclease